MPVSSPPKPAASHWKTDWHAPRRILCVRLDGLGDLLMTTPAIAAIRETHPDCKLTLMTSSAGAVVAPLLPGIDEVLVYDAPWLKATAPRENSQPEYEWITKIRDRHFDAAIIFTVYSQSALPSAMMAYLADIPLRLAHCRENPYQLLSHYLPEPEPQQFIRHEVQRQLDLVASIGCTTVDQRLRICVLPAAKTAVALQLQQLGLGSRQDWIVIHAGASAPSRRYPPEHFSQVAKSLCQQGITPVFTGVLSERSLIDTICEQMNAPAISLVGKLTLSEMTALLAAAPLLLSNNTGPVHLAAAVGTPVVDLYALTNVQHTPWQVPSRVLSHEVPCRLCYKSICPEGHHHCLRLVSPESVVAAVLDLLKRCPHPQTPSPWGEGAPELQSPSPPGRRI